MRMSEDLAQLITKYAYLVKAVQSGENYYYPEVSGMDMLTNLIKEKLTEEFPNYSSDPIYLTRGNKIYSINWDGSDFTIRKEQAVEVYNIRKVMLLPNGFNAALYVVNIRNGQLLLSFYKHDAMAVPVDLIQQSLDHPTFMSEDNEWVKIKADLPMALKVDLKAK